jgi:hypothetical protein
MHTSARPVLALTTSIFLFCGMCFTFSVSTLTLFCIFYLLNMSTQWWLYRWISMVEDNAENKQWLRIPAQALLLLIPAYYILGTVALAIMFVMYMLGNLAGG